MAELRDRLQRKQEGESQESKHTGRAKFHDRLLLRVPLILMEFNMEVASVLSVMTT